MGIPIGKLALYTACGGIHPSTALPILLDVGTDNQERLDDPLYIGWRHPRTRGAEYDAFVETFVSAVSERWPDVLLQWEDFARPNAGPLLDRYRDRLCTFNDDIQGTAAVATGTVLAAARVTGVPITEQRFVIVGAGSAGCGIGRLLLDAMVEAGLPEEIARRRFYAIGRNGLLIENETRMEDYQAVFAQPRAALAGWSLQSAETVGLLDVVRNAKPTVLIGTSAQPGIFSEDVVRCMAASVERPAIFPLSNPVSRAEAAPDDLMRWSDGRAVIGTGSPFPPLHWNGRVVPIAQANNSFIFPGVGLGVLAVGARRVTDGMFMAAARALAELSPAARDPQAGLLPSVTELRSVARCVGLAVARRAIADGHAAPCDDAALAARIAALMWDPAYPAYRRRK
jgi:malate dehydrogenase (oxaloacetate-decarboxylating)